MTKTYEKANDEIKELSNAVNRYLSHDVTKLVEAHIYAFTILKNREINELKKEINELRTRQGLSIKYETKELTENEP